jgi:transposase
MMGKKSRMQGKEVSEQGSRVRYYVGIDVCESWLDVPILPDEVAFRVANTGAGHRLLKRRLRGLDVELIVIEATGKWHRQVHRSLNAAGWRVAVVNPLRARLFAEAIGALAKPVLGPAAGRTRGRRPGMTTGDRDPDGGRSVNRR